MDLIGDRNLVLIFGLCLVIIASCQQADKFTSHDPCSTRQTCHECIQTQACAWCSQPNFEDQRCFMPKLNMDIQKRCSASYIFEPRNVYSDISSSIDETMETGVGKGTFTTRSSETLAAITPQRVYLKLRVNDPYRMPLRYQQNPNYPVDLYYLMDLSNSMKDDKEQLYKLGNKLAETMKNITSDFRLGFGSFVDKVVMPYVSTAGKNLQEPCTKCAAPYGFQNVMSLDQNTSRFAGEVQNAQVSGNLDAPEGGFDAIMQAIVCRKEIGWRHKARKLLVFSTDAPFHYAGDGKLGGIVKPNDGCCHLDGRGRYTHSTIQDYPSISQVNMKVKENSVNIIFAVTADQVSLYERLGKHVEGAYCGTLLGDSGNVVDLVKDQYSKITSSVEMKDTASKFFKISYYSKCLNQNGDLIKTSRCDGLKVNQTVQFEIEVEVTHCPANPQDWKQTFIIYPVGVNETLTVMVDIQCDCPCEIKGHPGYEEHSSSCSNSGTLKCGICECDVGYFGRKCECDPKGKTYESTITGLINGCRPNNVTDRDCSDHGTCVCNRCECDRKSSTELYYGQYCECDNFSCDRNNGTLCSGHGKCECNGMCTCDPGYSGNACECTTDTTNCIVPGTNEICSGKGECKCGVCKCVETPEGRYTGPQCQKCPTCPGKCPELKNCVQCKLYQTGPLTKEECEKNCTFFVLKAVDVVEMREDYCQYFDEEECRFSYVYYQDENNRLVVSAQKQRDCPPHVFILGFVFGLIGAIVLIGLALLLVWKLLTTIHDRREFAKFEKERVNAKWDTGENPIYKQATSTFKNPTYIGK